MRSRLAIIVPWALFVVGTSCADDPAPVPEPALVAEPPTIVEPVEEEPAQFDIQSDSEEDPLYAAPVIERARAIRRGRRVRLRLRWSPVVDATQYELQVARNLTFRATAFVTDVTGKRSVTTPLLPLGLYFARVRAVGDVGAGPWSAAKAIAPRSGPREPGPPEPVAITPAASAIEGAPLTLRIFDLADRSLSSAPSLQIRGRSLKGASVAVGEATTEAAPEFELMVKLVHGRNDVIVVATLDEQRIERTRVVYYADPRKVQKDLTELRALRQQLDDLREIQSEVRSASQELEGALKGAPAEEAKALQADLDEIERASEELDSEVRKAFDAVQRLLQDPG